MFAKRKGSEVAISVLITTKYVYKGQFCPKCCSSIHLSNVHSTNTYLIYNNNKYKEKTMTSNVNKIEKNHIKITTESLQERYLCFNFLNHIVHLKEGYINIFNVN